MRTRMIAAVSTLSFLVACGGGGGSDSPGTSMMDSTPALPPSQVGSENVLSADPTATRHTATAAATTLPAFGSVTQSATRDGVSGIATDRASTTFDGDNLTLRVDRQSGSDLVLSTADDYTELGAPGPSPLQGHDTWRDGYIIDYTAAETTIGYGVVSWDSNDPTDYLSGGYWLHATGDLLSTSFTIDEAGAFVDGPEIRLSNRPDMPVQGTASYSGEAEGLYAVEYGSDAPGYEGTTELGIFGSEISLTADFTAETIGGCVGCQNGIYLDGDPSDYRVRLGATPFASDGTFRGTSVTLEHPDISITSTSGAWGGMFSNVPNANGDPRLVAGTVGGEATSSGGSEAVFVGAYYATAE